MAIILGGTISPDEIDALLKQIEIGLPADGLDLTAIPISLARGDYLALYNAGIRNLGHVWAMNPAALPSLLGEKRAFELERFRPVAGSASAS
jgi:hypothetical protein